MNNQFSNVNIPIPTETSLFSEDGEIDPELKWRWWFKLPDIWTTSNIGEKIVGIRSIYLMKNRRKIKYTLHLKKYKYTKTETAEMIDEKTVNELTVRMVSWLPVDKDLRVLFSDLIPNIRVKIAENNRTKTPEQVAFVMSELNAHNRDIQMECLKNIRTEDHLWNKYIVRMNILLRSLKRLRLLAQRALEQHTLQNACSKLLM